MFNVKTHLFFCWLNKKNWGKNEKNYNINIQTSKSIIHPTDPASNNERINERHNNLHLFWDMYLLNIRRMSHEKEIVQKQHFMQANAYTS